MNWDTEIDIEDVIGALGVGLTAAGLYMVGLVWMLLFLGVTMMGLAAWIGISRRRVRRG